MMDMDMSSTNTSMSNSTSMSMSSGQMPMVFTTAWSGIPILFPSLKPTTEVYFFGVWLAIFFSAIVYRGLGCLRSHLEATCWNPQYREFSNKPGQKLRYVQPFSIARDGGRLLLTLVTATLGYGLMLVVMSFIVAYFFAVVTGLAIGELIFARLYVRSGYSEEQDHH